MRVWTLTLAATLVVAPALVVPAEVDAQRRRNQRQPPAQSAEIPTHTRAFFAVGWRQVDVEGLNASMTAAGYPEVAEDFITLGGGMQLFARRVMIGLEGYGLLGTDSEVSRDEFDATIGGGYGLLTVGLAAIATPHFRLYPMGSVGAGAMTLEIAEAGRVSFDEILTEPGRGAHLSQVSFIAGAGLGTELLVPLGSGNSGRMLSVGLAGGYTFAPVTSRWQLYRNNLSTASVTGGPDIGIEGPFARLTLGFASVR